jgi:hypothetical protein
LPSVSRAQHAVGAMSTTPAGRKQLRAWGMKPMPVKVGKDFIQADRGKHFPNEHVRPKNSRPSPRTVAETQASR